MYDLKAYTIPIEELDLAKVLNAWGWLTGENKKVIALTNLGDILLKDEQGRLYFIDTGRGKLEMMDESYLNFLNGKLGNNTYEEILMTILVDKLEFNKKILRPNQVYSFYKLPVLGGRYIIENIYPLDLYEHFEITGAIHLNIKDLPGGTNIEFESGP